MKIPHTALPACLAACASLALFASAAHADCTSEIAGVEKELMGSQVPENSAGSPNDSQGAKVAEALARAKAAAAEDDSEACMEALEEARELAGKEEGTSDQKNKSDEKES